MIKMSHQLLLAGLGLDTVPCRADTVEIVWRDLFFPQKRVLSPFSEHLAAKIDSINGIYHDEISLSVFRSERDAENASCVSFHFFRRG